MTDYFLTCRNCLLFLWLSPCHSTSRTTLPSSHFALPSTRFIIKYLLMFPGMSTTMVISPRSVVRIFLREVAVYLPRWMVRSVPTYSSAYARIFPGTGTPTSEAPPQPRQALYSRLVSRHVGSCCAWISACGREEDRTRKRKKIDWLIN